LDKPLTVLLVEDDREECKEYARLIDTIDGIRLVGVTNNKNKALAYVRDYIPEAVILDLELQSGVGNGIDFLESLGEKNLKIPMYILVATHNISRVTHERVRELGADFIMVKSKEDYSVGNVVDFLFSLKKTIQNMRIRAQKRNSITAEGLAEENSPAVIRKRHSTRVISEIDRIGISPKALGRTYLIDAIMQRIEGKPGRLLSIAQKYSKTEASVERAMQNAINKAWSTMDADDLLMYYTAHIHSDKGVPTVTEFVCHYANKISAEI